MRHDNLIINDCFGQSYVFFLNSLTLKSSSVLPKLFTDELAADRFVRSFANNQKALSRLKFQVDYGGYSLAQMLVRGKLQVYELPRSFDNLTPKHDSTYSCPKSQNQFRICHVLEGTISGASRVMFNHKRDIENLVSSFDFDDSAIAKIENTLDSQTTSSRSGKTPIIRICDAIERGTLAIFNYGPKRTPRPKPLEELVPVTAGCREVPLAPESPEEVKSFTFMYQLDTDADSAKNDEIILQHNESNWTQTIAVSGLSELDDDWVQLSFSDLPESGTFNMLQDPKDGEDPYFVFWDAPYAKLAKITPATETMDVIADEEDAGDTAAEAA